MRNEPTALEKLVNAIIGSTIGSLQSIKSGDRATDAQEKQTRNKLEYEYKRNNRYMR